MNNYKKINISLKEIVATRKKYYFLPCSNLLDVDISDISLELQERKLIDDVSFLLSIKYDIVSEVIRVEYIPKK
ncbi:MAG: hypothetical protein ACRC6T_11595 [Sarcina sp.]